MTQGSDFKNDVTTCGSSEVFLPQAEGREGPLFFFP